MRKAEAEIGRARSTEKCIAIDFQKPSPILEPDPAQRALLRRFHQKDRMRCGDE